VFSQEFSHDGGVIRFTQQSACHAVITNLARKHAKKIVISPEQVTATENRRTPPRLLDMFRLRYG
jgi:hypothetical protein